MDLFSYPSEPGWKRAGGTSQEAAERIAPYAKSLKQRILDLLWTGTTLTPDEIAAKLKADKISVRARCTELKAVNLVEETGRQRQNASGLRAEVVRAVK